MRYLIRISANLYMVWFRYKSQTPMAQNGLHKRATIKPSGSFTYPFF